MVLALKNIVELGEKGTEDYRKNLVNEQAELEACSVGYKGCIYFLKKYAWIINRNTAKKVKWEPWEYHLDVIEALCTFPDIILFKARQLGWSWLISGWADWKLIFEDAAKGLFISAGETKAWDMIAKARFIHSHLPRFLALREKHADNRALMDFVDSDSQLIALPSTQDAGRSTDATFVARDELRDHPYGGANFTSVGPTVDAGGVLVDLSTIAKDAPHDDHFTERINRAMLGAQRINLPSGLVVFHGGDSKAVLIFGGWKLRPVRQEGLSLEEWFELRVKPKYTSFQIEAEYPETIEEALKPSKTRAFFDLDALDDIYSYMKPIETSEIDLMGGMIKIYQLPIVGEKYCVFTDPSDGRDDPHASGVLHNRTGNVVAISHGKVTADRCAKAHDTLVRFYNEAFNSFEINATAGGKFAETLKQLETPKRRGFRKGKPTDKDEGWWTSGQTKKDMQNGLEEAVRKRAIMLHNAEATAELRAFIIPEGDEPQPSRGFHDDWVMMLGGLWQISKYMPISSGEMKSYPYRR